VESERGLGQFAGRFADIIWKADAARFFRIAAFRAACYFLLYVTKETLVTIKNRGICFLRLPLSPPPFLPHPLTPRDSPENSVVHLFSPHRFLDNQFSRTTKEMLLLEQRGS